MSHHKEATRVRPLTHYEMFYAAAHDKGFMVTCYCLTLNSKQPLQECQMRRSLSLLRREIPILRLCIRTSSEEGAWFYESEEDFVDFQILENVDFQEEYEAMIVHRFDTYNGPLWCARLLPLVPDAPCAMPEIKDTFPHQYQFLFGFHHAITDGWSNIRICNTFLNRLNDVISGNDINDLGQLTEQFREEQTPKLKAEVQEELRNNPAELEYHLQVLKGSMEDLLFYKAFPPPQNISPKVINIPHSLSEEKTAKLMTRCKKEGVTLNSGLCSVFHSAMVEMLVKAGIKQDTYKLKHCHATNNRRYWEGDTSRSFGNFSGKLTLVSEANGDLKIFWNEARTFHKTITDLLQNRTPIKEDVAMFINIPPGTDVSGMTEQVLCQDNCYVITNMGNMKSVFDGEGDYVQATDFRRTTSTSNLLCTHVIRTFRGRLVYGLDYDMSLMAKETAQTYVKTIFRLLNQVLEM